MKCRMLVLLATAYVASSVFAARGEVGNSTVEVRALFNRDASTDLDIRTNGTIARLELSSADVLLDVPRALTVKLYELLPDDGLHVRTHVYTDNPLHHDVVELDEVVRRRPDLFVSEIVAPPLAVAGLPTIIRATVRELNGDVGASANCRLFADGVEIDQVENMHVEAGSTVQCAFAPVFDVGGIRQLAVVADGVEPGDWDDSNNASALAAVDVTDAAFGGYSAAVREEAFASLQRMGRAVRTTSTIAQSFRFEAWLPHEVTTGAALTVTSNNETLFAGEGPVMRPRGSRCAVTSGTVEVTACDVPRLGVTRVDLFRGSGEVIHRSTEWARHFALGEETADEATPPPIAARFGDRVEISVVLGNFRETVTVPLQRTTSTWDAASAVEIYEERSMLTGTVRQSRKGGFSLK